MEWTEQIYTEYSVPVYRYLYTLTHNTDLAEELTQDTFLDAVRCMDRYDGSCKLLVWLCQIGKHKWFDWLKKQKHRQTVPFEEELTAAPGTGPEDIAAANDATLRLYAHIHALPPNACEVVLLRSLGGLSFREIGEIMGISENGARVLFHRAKQKLAERMQQDE